MSLFVLHRFLAPLVCVLAYSQHAWCELMINESADPWILRFWTQVGPDGPWNAMAQNVDNPDQGVIFMPSLTPRSVFMTSPTCSSQSAACEVDTNLLWSESSYHADLSWTNSTHVDVSHWDNSLEPLRLEGQGTYTTDVMSLEYADRPQGFLDGLAVILAQNITVKYPQDSYYTLITGFFSLDGQTDGLSWTTLNGSEVTYNRTLPTAYQSGSVPSISYELQIGSVSMGINGSLILGGYDRSLILTDSISSSNQTFRLLDIQIGVSQGGSAFLNGDGSSTSGLLSNKSNPVASLQTMPNPGVPYMYLPAGVCAAIAQYLPVTFRNDLGLYIWNTSDPSFQKIVSSPHYLSFTFASEGSKASNGTISVPFALLNLTLGRPVVSTALQYFPCSPYAPADGETYHLGRAFLQAAYLSQNWQANWTSLSQAPGPDIKKWTSEEVKSIASIAEFITPMQNPPPWVDTWASKLEALAENVTGSAVASATTPSSSSSSPSGSSNSTSSSNSSVISGGAIAGAVLGGVSGVTLAAALVYLLLHRRNRRYAAVATPNDEKDPASVIAGELNGSSPYSAAEAPAEQLYEVYSPQRPVEIDGDASAVELENIAPRANSS